MKTRNIFLVILGLIFIITFLFVLPIPVENIEGAKNQDQFIYGGLYYTSGIEQLMFHNYNGMFVYSLMFLTIVGGIYFLKWDE